MNDDQQNEMQLQMPPEIQGGVYANQTMVTHTPEEFVFDFMLITPPVATVNARVIVTPAHAKRIAAVLAENIRKYEAMFGEVEANLPPEPDTGQMH